MNTLGYILIVAALAVAVYYGQQMWTKGNHAAYRRKIARSLETLDDIKEHAKEFSAKELIKTLNSSYISWRNIYMKDITLLIRSGVAVLRTQRSNKDKQERPVAEYSDGCMHGDKVTAAVVVHKTQYKELHTRQGLYFSAELKVTDNVYMAIGYALANSIMIIGPDGVVIVDVTESFESGAEVLEAFRKVTRKPITDIIYSHNHADHVYGAKAFIEDETNMPNIWAHSTITKAFALTFSGANLAGFSRAMRQFGVFLPEVSAGIGFKLRAGIEGSTIAPLYPTQFVNESETDLVLAGIPMKIVHIPGETDDQIGVWLPQQKAFLCADDIYKAFPNLYAIRGTTPRNLLQWVSSLDIMIDLEPEILVPSHTRPVQGRETVMKLLIEYRDAIQFVHDQTIRYINYGYHPDEIANMLSLPNNLASNPYLKEFYGTIAWSSKSVFAENMGWFSGDPVELHPLTRSEKAEKMVEMVGVETIIKTAQAALKSGDFQWALELSSYAIRVNPNDKIARDIKIEALTSLGSREISNNGRNYYLTCALEVATDLKLKGRPEMKANLVESFPIQFSMSTFSTLFKPETCGHKNETVYIELTEPSSNHFIQMRNSVAIVKQKVPKHWDLKIKSLESTWKDIILKRRNAVAAVALGDLEVEGGVIALGSFFDCFDRDIEQIDLY